MSAASSVPSQSVKPRERRVGERVPGDLCGTGPPRFPRDHSRGERYQCAPTAAIATRRSPERAGAPVTVGAPGSTSSIASISIRTSPMSLSRCFGSFVRQRQQEASNRHRCRSRQCRPVRLALEDLRDRVRDRVAGNATRPVTISKRTQPKAQMSVRLSTGSPRACSGLM